MEFVGTTANINNDYGKDFIRKFLVFMESDSIGAITKERVNHQHAIRFLLDKHQFALDFYSEFINTSTCCFPSVKNLVDTIDEANLKTTCYEKKSHFLCMHFWLYIYH